MADDAAPHADVLNSTAQGQLKSIIDRVERLAIEKAEIEEQIKEVYLEAKGNGFDVKILKKVVRLRKVDRAKRQEEEALTDLYLSALGDLPLFQSTPSTPAATASPTHGDPGDPEDAKGITTVTLTMADGSAVAATPDQMGAALKMVEGVSQDQALYDQAVSLVLRDGKASTSYVQRCLQLGYNKAANLMERMERDGVVGPPNHAGKREILKRAA